MEMCYAVKSSHGNKLCVRITLSLDFNVMDTSICIVLYYDKYLHMLSTTDFVVNPSIKFSHLGDAMPHKMKTNMLTPTFFFLNVLVYSCTLRKNIKEKKFEYIKDFILVLFSKNSFFPIISI